MKQPMYIRAATAISPQQSFERAHFLKPLLSTDTGRLYAAEAPYAQYINPVAIRRMSRIMKMTISAAMQCLKEADVKTPDAIITGTGRGGVTDMEVFVKDMIRMDEEALNPTAFIQSTYNSPNGWIAMQSGCTCYNQTYVHRGCSFELALLDAQMLLSEADSAQYILTGCYDEMTEDYYRIRSARAYWKAERINSANLLQHSDSAGTIGGEGACFLVLSNTPENAPAALIDLSILHDASAESINDAALQLIAAAGLDTRDISLMLTGLNGDVTQSGLYREIFAGPLKSVPTTAFKHLCGEYDTAIGFGLWLANELIGMRVTRLDEVTLVEPPKNILLVNHYVLGIASLALISSTIAAH